ncbi:hypothetical protein ABBQ38_008053 [Trebouxia sp. C0009 RCD-2024]
MKRNFDRLQDRSKKLFWTCRKLFGLSTGAMSSSVTSMHRLLNTPLGQRLGTVAASGTVMGLGALGVYLGQEYRSSGERERLLTQRCETLQARVHELELSERDSLVEGAMAFIMSAESHAEIVCGKRLARRKIRTAKDAVAGSKASNQELIEEIKALEEIGSEKDKKIRDLNIRCFDLADEMEFLDTSATNALESEWEMRRYMRSGFQAEKKVNGIVILELEAQVVNARDMRMEAERQVTEVQEKLTRVEGRVYDLQAKRKEDAFVILELEAQLAEKESHQESQAPQDAEGSASLTQASEEKERTIKELQEQLQLSDKRTLEVQEKLARMEDQFHDLKAKRKEDAVVILELEAQVAAVEEAHQEPKAPQDAATIDDSSSFAQENEALRRENSELKSMLSNSTAAQEGLERRVSNADDTIKAVRASEAAAKKAAEAARKEQQQLKEIAAARKREKQELSQKLKTAEQEKQDHQRSKDIQVQKAISKKEEAVNAAGSLKGQVKTLTREKSNLKEQLEVGVPLHDLTQQEELKVRVKSLEPQAGDSSQAKEALSLPESTHGSQEDPHADSSSMTTLGGTWDDGRAVVGPVRSPRRSTSFGARRRLLRRTESQG